ncbi:hypothetical protein [Flavivirga spongiicola]|uniref:AlgX/AlgJ SGNH hydrolase-like domain-containing protein n=1 Tax=Flavivirga spongiicola TaxID=421621 RepID=A0ABU7XPJ2_9FLAO|nr:hypothetical protein [Flavivirga sp. MEBiC05379]MDO5977707.1 hypothetical protein [Flavivirga sp. MEBiC05379]
MKKNILLLIVFSVFIFLVVEICFRFFYPQITQHDNMYEHDEVLGWKFIPNKKGTIVYPGEAHHSIKINSMGFRDNPLSDDRGEKILVLGDSFVSNISVKDDDVFTEIMEQNLVNTSVLNFGVNGYGQVQEYLQLQKWFNVINPDLIISVIYIRNDFTDNVKDTNWPSSNSIYTRPLALWNEENQEVKLQPVPPPIKEIISKPSDRFYHKLHIYHFIRTRIYTIRDRFFKKDESKAYSYTPPELYLCRSEPSTETEVMYKTMERMLFNISNFIKEKRVPIVFAIAPSIVQVEDELWSSVMENADGSKVTYIRTLPNDKLMAFAKKNNWYMIDLLPELLSETRKGKKLYNPLEQHWTVEGNHVVSHLLLKYLKDKHLIE